MSPEPHNPEEKWKKENKPTESHHSKLSGPSGPHQHFNQKDLSKISTQMYIFQM